MRIWAVLFAGTGIVFIASPNYIPDYVTKIGSEIFGWQAPALNFGAESFWIVMGAALLFTLAYVSIVAQRNLVRNINYAKILMLAKFLSCAGFAFCFFSYGKQFLYLVAAAIDLLILIITWRFYSLALRSRA